MPNQKLAENAKEAVIEGTGDTTRGKCQRFVRQRVQSLYGARFDAYHRESASKSLRAWAQSQYAHDPANGEQIGDILYIAGTRSNPHGHVGIRIEGNLVAENSTRRSGRRHGGHGFVPRSKFGRVALVVRLPVP